MRNIYLISLIGMVLMVSCNTREQNTAPISTQEHLVYATIWYQNSPEAKACYYQGYNLAKERVLSFNKMKSQKPKAVVVDIDETMFDNSAFQAQQIVDSKGFTPEFWKEWTDLAKAKALPGAVEFSNFCDSLGIPVFYISNRKSDEINSTLKNLDSLGFSFAKKEYLFFKENSSSKEDRRKSIAIKYEIILLIGDNLNDFSDVFENRGEDWGAQKVDEFKNEFGRKFIILPNPMYGEWEKNIYKGQKDLTVDQERSLRIGALKGFRLAN